MDIKTIVNKKIDELMENKTIETLVSESVENSIKQVIKEQFTGYRFIRQLEEKLKAEVDVLMSDISLKSYNQVMLDRMKLIISELQGEDLANQLENHYKSIFVAGESFKISEIFEAFREELMNDDGDNYGEYFTLVVEDDRDNFIRYYFDEDSDKSKYSCDYMVGVHTFNGKSEIFTLKLKGVDLDKGIIKPAHLSNWEKKLINAYLQDTNIEVDVHDEDDVDTSIYEEY